MNRLFRLHSPLSEADVRQLSCGDSVLLSGRIYTARDAAHKYLASDNPHLPEGLLLEGMAIYHCGPVMIQEECGGRREWKVTAAGPTTSAREEPYMGEVIRRYKLRAVIGKGGMGAATLEACRQYGCVYLSAVGGAAQVLAQAVTAVREVYFMDEFGSPEAIWALDVKDFPAIVTMDAAGNNLHAQVDCDSRSALTTLLGK